MQRTSHKAGCRVQGHVLGAGAAAVAANVKRRHLHFAPRPSRSGTTRNCGARGSLAKSGQSECCCMSLSREKALYCSSGYEQRRLNVPSTSLVERDNGRWRLLRRQQFSLVCCPLLSSRCTEASPQPLSELFHNSEKEGYQATKIECSRRPRSAVLNLSKPKPLPLFLLQARSLPLS